MVVNITRGKDGKTQNGSVPGTPGRDTVSLARITDRVID